MSFVEGVLGYIEYSRRNGRRRYNKSQFRVRIGVTFVYNGLARAGFNKSVGMSVTDVRDRKKYGPVRPKRRRTTLNESAIFPERS